MTKKVIIIDDSITSLNLIKTAFAKANWEVWGIQESNKALELIYDIAPDIIITDAIMPKIGGFSLVRLIKQNEDISLIPTIVYSVLDKKNAKFYIKDNQSEYFLKKEDNIDELLDLAYKIVKEHPLSEDYKLNILKASLRFHPVAEKVEQAVVVELEEPVVEKKEFNKIDFENKVKQNYDFSLSDEKIIQKITSILYQELEYNLCVINLNSTKTVYFDIKDFILSPIFRNAILKKYDSKNPVLFKKYAPNLKTIVNEDEFFSNISFSFEYKEKEIAHISFFSKEKSKWTNEQEKVEFIKNILNSFFVAREINKKRNSAQKDSIKEKYLPQMFEKINLNNDDNLYFAILEINNYSYLIKNLNEEETDILNLKISKNIVDYLDKNEQVYKTEADEYNIIIYAKNEKQAYQKLNFIKNIINSTSTNSISPIAIIGASCCKCEGSINFFQAQKNARKALDLVTKEETTVIKNAEE